MSLNTSARKTVQEGDRLLSQKLFEFLGRHLDTVIRETLFVKRLMPLASSRFESDPLRLTPHPSRHISW
jgi:hypothetical protein